MNGKLEITAPATVGLSAERLTGLDDHLRRTYVDTGRAAGTLTLVARGGRVAHLGLTGMADRERGTPLGEDTLFRIYSMTKPLTSVLFMMLVEEGKVALDDPVGRFLPGWDALGVHRGGALGDFRVRPADRPMLMVDLLRHTSGLTYAFQDRTPVDAAYTALGLGVLGAPNRPLDAMVEALGGLPLEFSPGSAWNYSVSTDVLGHLIGVIEGRPFDTVMQTRLLDPLGMTDTGFHVPPSAADRLAACYVVGPDGRTVLQDDPKTSPYLKPPVLVSGGGGLVSTAADYLAFCRMMLDGGAANGMRFLSPKTIALMTANHLPGGVDLPALSVSMFSEAAYDGVGFGLGFAVTTNPARTLLAGSTGDYFWGGAAGTYFWIDPVEDLIVIFMTQVLKSTPERQRRTLRTMVYAAIEATRG